MSTDETAPAASDVVIDPLELLELIEKLSRIGNESIKLQRVVNEFVSALIGPQFVLLRFT